MTDDVSNDEVYSQLEECLQSKVDKVSEEWAELFDEKPALLQPLKKEAVEKFFAVKLSELDMPSGKIGEALTSIFAIAKYVMLYEEQQEQISEAETALQVLGVTRLYGIEYSFAKDFSSCIRFMKMTESGKYESFIVKYKVLENKNVEWFIGNDALGWKVSNAVLMNLLSRNEGINSVNSTEKYESKSENMNSNATVLTIKGVKITIESNT